MQQIIKCRLAFQCRQDDHINVSVKFRTEIPSQRQIISGDYFFAAPGKTNVSVVAEIIAGNRQNLNWLK